MITSVLRAATLLALCLFPLQHQLCAQVFHPDTSFGTNGFVAPNGFPAIANKNQLKKVLVQADGKILLVGAENGQSTLEIVRLNTNGSVDATYGSNGYLQLSTPTSVFANAGLGPDGKVVAIFATQTQSNSYSTLYRLNTNGTTDNTFGSGGTVVLTNGNYGGYSGIVFQPDGKMVLGGSRYVNSSCALYGITRLKTNGAYDSTFGVNGKIENVYPQFAARVTNATCLALQSDGKIVMATGIPFYTPTNNALATIRFKPNGVVDSSFATNGCNIHTIDSVDVTPAGIAVDGTSGAVVVFGASSSPYAPLPGYSYKPFILKLTSAGAPASFGTNGHVIVNMLLSDQLGVRVFPPSGFLQPDGKLVIAGPSDSTLAAHTRVCRINTNGQPDNTFSSTGGIMDIARDVRDMPISSALQTNGDILLSGFTFNKKASGSQVFDSCRMYCIRITNKTTQGIGRTSRAAGNIYAYPNPAAGGHFYLKYEGVKIATTMQLVLCDITGRTVTTHSFTANRANGELEFIPSHSLSPGIYLLKVFSDDSAFPGIRLTIDR